MIGVINCGSSKTRYIEELVYEFDDFVSIPLLDATVESLYDLKGIIISGAPILLTETDHTPFKKPIETIIDSGLPILGICFGHQLLSMHFGGYVARMKEDRDWQTIEVISDSHLFDKLPNEFEMMEDHCETASIPNDFIHLAVSDVCINEAMQHKTKPIYSVQFHPEVSGNSGRIIFDNFIRICHQV